MGRFKLSLALILTVLLLVLVLQNAGPVETRIFFKSFVLPQALLLLATAGAGFALGVLATLIFLKNR